MTALNPVLYKEIDQAQRDLVYAAARLRALTGEELPTEALLHGCAPVQKDGVMPISAVVGLFQTVLHKLESVRTEYHEMKTIKERLEKMQAEKLFAFTDGIDPDSFRVLCSILANGDVAKASRALNMKDSTLRTRVVDWETRGPTYKVLIELVRWRKSIGRKGIVPLNESIIKGTAAHADFAGLLADVLDEVLEMTEENWEEKADALANLLRPYVPR